MTESIPFFAARALTRFRGRRCEAVFQQQTSHAVHQPRHIEINHKARRCVRQPHVRERLRTMNGQYCRDGLHLSACPDDQQAARVETHAFQHQIERCQSGQGVANRRQ